METPMSEPQNPLFDLIGYEPRHLLIAFDNAESACRFSIPDGSLLGKSGSEVPLPNDCGNAVVVINELVDRSYSIHDLEWSFDFFSPTTPNTTISGGNFTVADAKGNQFPSFLRRVSKKLGIPLTRVSFYMMTVFRGRLANSTTSVNYPTKPLIINLTDTSAGFRDDGKSMFTLNFVMCYNTVAQLPNYSKLAQFTITNGKHNAMSRTPAIYSKSTGILSRAEADALNNPQRKARIEKTSPMRNLKDVFDGFNEELKQMRFTNKRQVQEFLSVIRPSSVKKIKVPEPKRVKKGESLPITFKVDLDKAYHGYPVDNLNLMTEQTENGQGSTGISSMTVPPGSSVFSAVEELIKLSSRVGADVRKGYGFKTVMSSVIDCEGIVHNTINVKRYKIPKNKLGEPDTGPDKLGTVKALELRYMDGQSGLDVISLSFATSPSSDAQILEEDSDDLKNDSLYASSQREQLTFERADNSGFSGLRTNTNPRNYGLQKAGDALMVDTLKFRFGMAQNTLTTVTILGNPDLYSDLARCPLAVSKQEEDSPKLYRFPEYHPMYISLTVRIGNAGVNASTMGKDDEEFWYHTYHYHLSGVTNRIFAGKFIQTLRLLSSDDAI
jgi:hypothetical protein